MIALALDTSHSVGSMALAVDGTLAQSVTFGRGESHLLEIGKSLNRLAAGSGVSVRDINRVVLVAGPGSFTGLRIGMSFVKGLHAAVGCEIATVDTLMALAMPLLDNGYPVVSMVNAKRSEIYGAAYLTGGVEASSRAHVVFPPRVGNPGDFLRDVAGNEEIATEGKIIFAGSGAGLYSQLVGSVFGGKFLVEFAEGELPRTEYLAESAGTFPAVPSQRIGHMEPIYIRPSDAELKKLREAGDE